MSGANEGGSACLPPPPPPAAAAAATATADPVEASGEQRTNTRITHCPCGRERRPRAHRGRDQDQNLFFCIGGKGGRAGERHWGAQARRRGLKGYQEQTDQDHASVLFVRGPYATTV